MAKSVFLTRKSEILRAKHITDLVRHLHDPERWPLDRGDCQIGEVLAQPGETGLPADTFCRGRVSLSIHSRHVARH